MQSAVAAVAAVLMALGLRLTRPWEGERRPVPEQEEEGGGPGGLEKEGKQKEQFPLSKLFKVLRNVPSCTHPLRCWLVQRLCESKAFNIAYYYLLAVKQALLTLRPSLPSTRSSTPASLQAALLQPAAQKAMLPDT